MAMRQYGGKNEVTLQEHRQAVKRAAAELPACIVVFGECEFLRTEAVMILRDAWLAKNPDGDLSTIRGTGESKATNPSDIARELSGGSLFAKEKLVIVRQAEKALFPQTFKSAEIEPDTPASSASDRDKALLDRVENPAKSIWLLIETAQLPKNRTLGKKLAALCTVIPCPNPTQRDLPVWLFERAGSQGKNLDDEASDLLIRAHGADLGVLAREIDKLTLFAGDGESIDAGMVGEFLTGSIEFDVFGFTNAIEARNLERAVFYARRITEQGTRNQKGKKEDGANSAHRILAMLAGTVQGLLRARVALAERLSAADFAVAEKLSPWRAGKVMEAAGKFELPELRSMTGFAADQLRQVHDTGGDPLLALEMMAVKFTTKRKG